MAIDPVGAVQATTAVPALPSTPPPSATTPSFAATLQAQLSRPRAEVAQIRAEVASLRDGGALRRSTAPPTADGSIAPHRLAALLAQQATGDSADAFGWRAMSRQLGDQVIAPGYGALFERQIQQESGFAPDVVYGLRRSTAGAEGIAQLMPQFYPGVARSDPRQGLLAGARTMQGHLATWDGDVRRALASYNAGLGRVQALVAAHGEGWEAKLPLETKQYLSAILGGARPRVAVAPSAVAPSSGAPSAGPMGPTADAAATRPPATAAPEATP
ncbi:MAG: hypothetical protein EXR64_05985 [Dehalococcoidia bacterium]|nr:hypothetical protein [Dehalococcoidia bacterium]